MIRRDIRLPKGRLASGQAGWALISQQQHAQLSGCLVARVASLPGAAEDRRQIVAAIARHDEGWAQYDAQPKLDDAGRPRSFTEMELAESLAIWSDSIAAAEGIGPLAAWLVAGHFAQLLRASAASRSTPDGRNWLARIADDRRAWLAAWGGAASIGETALEWLRTLDAASLWMCCTCPALGEPLEAAPALLASCGPVPAPSGWQVAAAGEIKLEDRRFQPGSFEVSVEGWQAPAASYGNWQALLTSARPCRLSWRIQAA